MDLSVYDRDFTQHDLFGLFPGAPGGRALRDTYGRDHLISIATKGGQTTLERYGKEYMRELASRGEDICPMVGAAVAEYITQHRLYKVSK